MGIENKPSGGRPIGVKGLRVKATKFADTAFSALAAVASDDKADPTARVAAAAEILQFAKMPAKVSL